MKTIPIEIISDIINLIKSSSYYNKIQILFNKTDEGFDTETFYFWQGQWGHSIFREAGELVNTVVQDVESFDDDSYLITRLGKIEDDAKVIVASNSSEFVITVGL